MKTEHVYIAAGTAIIIALILATSQCSVQVNTKALECVQNAKDSAAAQLCERLGVH